MYVIEKEKLINILEDSIQSSIYRHEKVVWEDVLAIIRENDEILTTLYKMEETGGEPDVIVIDDNQSLAFIDCVKESPIGRRSVCYDEAALQSRKKYKPDNSAIEMAADIAVRLLTEREYHFMQGIEAVDE